MRTLSSIVLAVLFAVGAAAQPAPKNRAYTVAYASFGPLNSAIYIADADGGHERMVVGGPALDMNPSFSPDGASILFTSRRHGSADIYRVQTDGSRLERLTDHPAFDDQAAMSSDGRTVAFVSSRSGQADVWILDLTSKRLRNLTNHPGGDYRPAWSPDGQWLAFTSDRDSDGARASTPASRTSVLRAARRPSFTSSAPTGPAFGDSPTATRPSAARPGRATARAWSSTRPARPTGAP